MLAAYITSPVARPQRVFAIAVDDGYDAGQTKLKCGHACPRSEEVKQMKFPGGLNIQQMMKQAQQMQEKMAREMDEMRVEASAGGGVVNVTMKGDHEILSLRVDPELVKENDVEMLQDMILAAVNEANRKVNEAMKSKLGSMLPPGLGNLF
jgi:nucleoid-associated protein EbfC